MSAWRRQLQLSQGRHVFLLLAPGDVTSNQVWPSSTRVHQPDAERISTNSSLSHAAASYSTAQLAASVSTPNASSRGQYTRPCCNADAIRANDGQKADSPAGGASLGHSPTKDPRTRAVFTTPSSTGEVLTQAGDDWDFHLRRTCFLLLCVDAADTHLTPPT